MENRTAQAVELLMVVDEDDRFIEEKEKWECHRGDGILHRAFLVLVLNDAGELLLARRSPSKRLWPGFWDGTVASHVRLGESYEDAARRRLVEEMGIEGAQVTYITKFTYRAGYENMGSEHEVCAVLTAKGPGTVKMAPREDEISGTRFIAPGRVTEEDGMTPWLLLALKKPEVQSSIAR